MEQPNDKPHDVLAAEEFEIGARDDRYPDDPSRIEEPHDVLAAEEFAMPAGRDVEHDDGGIGPRALIPLAVTALIVVLLLKSRRS